MIKFQIPINTEVRIGETKEKKDCENFELVTYNSIIMKDQL